MRESMQVTIAKPLAADPLNSEYLKVLAYSALEASTYLN